MGFFHKESSLSPFHLLIHLLIHILWTHRYLFYSLCYNSLSFIFCSDLPALAFGSSFIWASGPLIFLFVLTLPHFLALQDAPGLSCIFTAPAFELPFFQVPLVPFTREWYLEIRIRALSVLFVMEVSILLGSW